MAKAKQSTCASCGGEFQHREVQAYKRPIYCQECRKIARAKAFGRAVKDK